VAIPLVLHGGSGIPEEIIRDCIRNGICKINVNTEISVYTVEKTRDLLSGAKLPHLAVVAEKQQQYVKEVVLKYMRFFQSA
jgi:fructose-bisphosphate aldolase class II